MSGRRVYVIWWTGEHAGPATVRVENNWRDNIEVEFDEPIADGRTRSETQAAYCYRLDAPVSLTLF